MMIQIWEIVSLPVCTHSSHFTHAPPFITPDHFPHVSHPTICHPFFTLTHTHLSHSPIGHTHPCVTLTHVSHSPICHTHPVPPLPILSHNTR